MVPFNTNKAVARKFYYCLDALCMQIGHLEQIFGLRWSFWVRATSLIIEKRRFLAYSTFKTFSFGFKVYVNFIVVEF